MLIQVDDFMVVDYTSEMKPSKSTHGSGKWSGWNWNSSGGRVLNTYRDNNPTRTSNYNNNYPRSLEDKIQDDLEQQTVNDTIRNINREELSAWGRLFNKNDSEFLDLKKLKKSALLKSKDLEDEYKLELEEARGYLNVGNLFPEDDEYPNQEMVYVERRDDFLEKLDCFYQDCYGEDFESLAIKYGEEFTNSVITMLMDEGSIYFDECSKYGTYDDVVVSEFTEKEKNAYYLKFLKVDGGNN